MACGLMRVNKGYSKLESSTDPDSAEWYKKAILASNNDQFVPFNYSSPNSPSIKYRLLSPTHVTFGKNYPLVLVLHSSGQTGTDNVSQLGLLAKMWATPEMQKKYPAYIVAPQFPVRSSNYSPLNNKHILTSTPDLCLNSALKLIDSLISVLAIDKRMIYVIGFSMGASSTINSIGLRPNLFAAAVSISGIPEFKEIATLAKTPLWFIHGNADNENPIQSDSLLYRQLQIRNAKEVKYWEIQNLPHAIYPPLFITNMIPKWLFKHKNTPVK